jgi:hypothetical protein
MHRSVGESKSFHNPEEIAYLLYEFKKTIDTIQMALGSQGWPIEISYSSAYRNIKERGYYTHTFVVEGVRYFELRITTQIINPHLTSLGIDDLPTPRRK